MTRLQAAIGGVVVPSVLILSIAYFAPEILGKPAAAPAAVIEPQSEAMLSPLAEADPTLVKPMIFKKMSEALPAAAALPEVPAAVASVPPSPSVSRCERYLYAVVLPKQDGLIDRLFDSRTEQALADQDRRRRLALNCLRAERGGDGR